MAISAKELSKKDLGQYFTPPAVVDFALDMARAIAGPKLIKTARVIDPACGAGAFLLAALDKGVGSPATIFGMDIDPAVEMEWEHNGLFPTLGRNLYLQNGLYDPEDGRISEKFPSKQFDLVIGNPPYGGIGVRGVQEDRRLLNALKTYELWRPYAAGNNEDQGNLFGVDILDRIRRLTPKEIERLERFPVEVLFLERFIRLAKPGGVVAVVVPDGILANIKFNYVRNWLAERCRVVAVVSLPRGTFRGAGTTAKTSLLFLRNDGKRAGRSKHVFMAQLDDGPGGGAPTAEEFAYVLAKFKENTADYARNSPVIWKNILSGEFWDNRWDAEFWDPTYTEPIKKLSRKFTVKEIGDIIQKDSLILGDHARKSRGELLGYGKKLPYEYFDAVGFTTLGYDYSNIEKCNAKTYKRLKRTEVEKDDILIGCSGVASAGKVCIIHFDTRPNCTGAVFILRINEPDPYFVTLFLKTRFGTLQFERLKSGIGTQNIRGKDILSLKVPFIGKKAKYFAKKYKNLFNDFDRLIDIKITIINKLGIFNPKDKIVIDALANNNKYIELEKTLTDKNDKLIKELERYLEAI